MDQSLLEEIQKQKERINTLKAEFQKAVKDKFLEIAKSVFEEHPILYSFAWNQYTPYFNDGDTCTFYAHTDYIDVRFMGEESETVDEDGNRIELDSTFDHENSEQFSGSFDKVWDPTVENKWGRKGDYVPRTTPLTEKELAAKAVLDFLQVFDDEDLLALFGDHVTVIVSREGVRTEECYHD